MIAVVNNQPEVALTLIKAGADRSIPDVCGRTPAEVAQRLKYKGIYAALTGCQ
jgi:anti-anti-sigma regulatory factor